MSLFRWIGSVLIAAALCVCVARPHETSVTAPLQTPCSVQSLSAAFTGPEFITQVAAYACEDGWAYMWATIGNGAHAIGVTEVLHFDVAEQRWKLSLRATVCSPKVLPHYIYEQGCFSN